MMGCNSQAGWGGGALASKKSKGDLQKKSIDDPRDDSNMFFSCLKVSFLKDIKFYRQNLSKRKRKRSHMQSAR